MTRLVALLAIIIATCTAKTAIAQVDLSVISITAPVSGCGLTATEDVTIKIFNYGATLPAATSFNVSYSINGGALVTELVTLPAPLTSNTTLTYTFTTKANLATSGTYTFDAVVSIAGDVSPLNDVLHGYAVANTCNIVLGTGAGSQLGTGNFNIDIGNPGVNGDNNTIRLGDKTVHTSAFIAGIFGNTTLLNDALPVVIDSDGHLGTADHNSLIGPQGPPGPQGPAGPDLVSGSILMLAPGATPPSGYTLIGPTRFRVGNGPHKTKVLVNVYRKN